MRKASARAREFAWRGIQSAAFVIMFLVMTSATGVAQEHADESPAAPEEITRQRPRGFLFQKPLVQIGLRGGVSLARSASSIFDFTTEQLTLDKSDFNAFTVGGDIAIRVVDPVDIVLGFAYASTSKSSEFREFVDQDDLPITQRTTFSHVPLTAALKVYLTPRGREIGRFAWVPARLSPYLGAGGGMMHYNFRQVGSFVDYQDLSIFDETFESDGWTPLAMVMAGLDFSISPRVVLNTDARYHWASAELNQDFIDFADGIDLSGIQLSLGFLFRL